MGFPPTTTRCVPKGWRRMDITTLTNAINVVYYNAMFSMGLVTFLWVLSLLVLIGTFLKKTDTDIKFLSGVAAFSMSLVWITVMYDCIIDLLYPGIAAYGLLMGG